MALETVFSFLHDLKENNNREWFQANKPIYLRARGEFEVVIELLIHEIRKFDSRVPALSPGDCIFRIYRDVRFSKDKSPYKTHFGAFITPNGRKGMGGGYYLHLEPGESMVAGGIHNPPAEVLRKIRSYVFDNPEELLEIIQAEPFSKLFGTISGESLKTAPKGFPKDFNHIDLLKYKSYTVYAPMDQADIMKDFPENVLMYFRQMAAFNDFLNRAVGIS